ncbi:uncharacterized protein LOC124420586 [Lucilia cuprina]|uniref:uncharacterized protein LOC124420586 n=1 Tax=Lucilia cuprina TaxID=7375 RepID=UPI001F066D4F|nr:uncharacterized protein LOC124420586 [Lucilia cuprina]
MDSDDERDIFDKIRGLEKDKEDTTMTLDNIYYLNTAMSDKISNINNHINNQQKVVETYSASSPRRVAVPVLVKDGKPCSGGNTIQSHSQQQVSSINNVGSNVVNGNNSLSSTINLINESAGSHSPDTSSSIHASYNGTVTGTNTQMLQQPCNNTIVSNSLAMAYRNQNNFMSNGHQQQCTGYLPLQGRAW